MKNLLKRKKNSTKEQVKKTIQNSNKNYQTKTGIPGSFLLKNPDFGQYLLVSFMITATLYLDIFLSLLKIKALSWMNGIL